MFRSLRSLLFRVCGVFRRFFLGCVVCFARSARFFSRCVYVLLAPLASFPGVWCVSLAPLASFQGAWCVSSLLSRCVYVSLAPLASFFACECVFGSLRSLASFRCVALAPLASFFACECVLGSVSVSGLSTPDGLVVGRLVTIGAPLPLSFASCCCLSVCVCPPTAAVSCVV